MNHHSNVITFITTFYVQQNLGGFNTVPQSPLTQALSQGMVLTDDLMPYVGLEQAITNSTLQVVSVTSYDLSLSRESEGCLVHVCFMTGFMCMNMKLCELCYLINHLSVLRCEDNCYIVSTLLCQLSRYIPILWLFHPLDISNF